MQFIKVILLLTLTVLSANEYLPKTTNIENFQVDSIALVDTTPKPVVDIDKDLGFNLKEFARIVASVESKGDWTAVSSSGLYIGLYQIGDLALKEVGIKNVSVKKFTRNPGIFPKDAQMLALKKLALVNCTYLETEIKRFDGKRMYGHMITKSGLLGAAHHIGVGRVKQFLYTGKVAKDGNGVLMTTLLDKMASIH